MHAAMYGRALEKVGVGATAPRHAAAADKTTGFTFGVLG